MAGKKKPLSPAQQIAVNKVKESAKVFRDARAEVEERVRQQVKEEMNALEMSYALSIRRARELGVPMSTIGVEGMGTSDPHTVRRWLKKTERLVTQVERVATGLDVFAWEDRDERAVRVRFEGFPTSAIEADNYPSVLEGVVRQDETSRTGWSIITDPGDVETELGTLPGWLTWEISDVPREKPGSLAGLLDEWVEANS